MKKLILLYGNCQVQPLAAILREMLPSVLIHVLPPNFMLMDGSCTLSDEDKRFIAELKESDIVVYQPLDQKHSSFGIESIIGNLASNTPIQVKIPYVVFKGYFPDVYSPNLNSSPMGADAISRSPFGLFPYGHHWMDELKDIIDLGSPSCLETIKTHIEARCQESDYRRQVENTIRILQDKENNCDITISDFILDNYQRCRLFHTYNHPGLDVFLELAKRLLALLEHEVEDLSAETRAALAPATFDDQELPIYPFVADSLGLRFDCSSIKWRGYDSIPVDKYLLEYFRHCLSGKDFSSKSDAVDKILEKIASIKTRLAQR